MQSSLVSMKSENDVRGKKTEKAVNFDIPASAKMQRWYSTDQVVMRQNVDKVTVSYIILNIKEMLK